MKDELSVILNRIPEFAKMQALTLPKLKKVSDSEPKQVELPKIQLPKLKKIE